MVGYRYSTPDFVKSECSINISGVKWDKETPWSFEGKPKSTNSAIDQRIVQIKGSRPPMDLPRGGEVLRYAQIQTSSSLNGKRRSNSASCIPVVDATSRRVSNEVSSLWVEGNGIRSRLARPSDSWAGKTRSSYYYCNAATPQAPLMDSVVKSKSYLSVNDVPNSGTLYIRGNSTTSGVASSIPRPRVAVNNYLVTSENGNDASIMKTPKCLQVKLPSSMDVKDGSRSSDSEESIDLRGLRVQGSSISPRAVPSSDTVLRTRGKSGIESSNSDHDSVTNGEKHSITESLTSTSLKDGTTRQHFSNDRTVLQLKNNRLSCPRASSVHSDTKLRSSSLLTGDVTKNEKLERVRRSASAKSESSREKVISPLSRRGFVESRGERESHALPHSIEKTLFIPSEHTTPGSTVNKSFTRARSSTRPSEVPIKRNKRKESKHSSKSPSKKTESASVKRDGSTHVGKGLKKTQQAKGSQTSKISKSDQSLSGGITRNSRIPIRTNKPIVVEADGILKENASKNCLQVTQISTIDTKSLKMRNLDCSESKPAKNKTVKKEIQESPPKQAKVNEHKVVTSALERRKAYEAKRKSEKDQSLQMKKVEIVAKRQIKKDHESAECIISETKADNKISPTPAIRATGFNCEDLKPNGHDCRSKVAASVYKDPREKNKSNDFGGGKAQKKLDKQEFGDGIGVGIVGKKVDEKVLVGRNGKNKIEVFCDGTGVGISGKKMDEKMFPGGNGKNKIEVFFDGTGVGIAGKKMDEKVLVGGNGKKKIDSKEIVGGKEKENVRNTEEETQAVTSQKESGKLTVRASAVKLEGGGDKDRDESCVVPFLNLMTNEEIQGFYEDFDHGDDGQLSGRANPNTARSDEEFECISCPHVNPPSLSQSGHEAPFVQQQLARPTHVNQHTGNRGTAKRKFNMQNRWKVGQGKKPPRIRSKPRSVKKKACSVDYVPEYEAIRVVAMDGGKSSQRKASPFAENRSRHIRPLGCVSQYGPMPGEPAQFKPDVPSGNVVLPPINFSRACNSPSDVTVSKGRCKKRGMDVCESRAQAKPFNTYVNEEASKRFERHYRRQY